MEFSKKGFIVALLLSAVVFAGGTATAAVVGAFSANADCTPAPAVTYSDTNARVTVTCDVPLPPPTTVTQTVTANPTTTTSTTTSPSSTTTSPSSTTTSPSSTTTTSPGTDWVRPTAATTGYSGPLTVWDGSTTFTANNQTISNVDFNGYVRLTGSNITLENCRFDGMVYFGPGPLTIKNCTSNSNINVDASYRNISGVTFSRVHVICGSHDGIDLFSQSNGRVSNVSITDSLIDGMSFPASSNAHGDGLQVRGINGLTVERVVFDMGAVQPQKNAAVYFENVNGGDTNMHLTNVDIYGGDPYDHTFYTNAVTNSTATNVAIKRGGYVTRVKPSGWVFNNVTGEDGSQISP